MIFANFCCFLRLPFLSFPFLLLDIQCGLICVNRTCRVRGRFYIYTTDGQVYSTVSTRHLEIWCGEERWWGSGRGHAGCKGAKIQQCCLQLLLRGVKRLSGGGERVVTGGSAYMAFAENRAHVIHESAGSIPFPIVWIRCGFI